MKLKSADVAADVAVGSDPMRILFASAHPYLPQIRGGAQSSTHELAVGFRTRGHRVAVLSGLTGSGWLGLRGRLVLKGARRNWVKDKTLGYDVYRAWKAQDAIADVARHFSADVIILQSGFPVRLAEAIDRKAFRTFIYLRNVEIGDLGGRPGKLRDVSFIANSQFTADRFAATDGLQSTVVHPMINATRYVVDSTRRNVTFINPHPDKGLETALSIAEACPDIPFCFVRAWTLSPKDMDYLKHRIAALPNVTLRGPTDDMRTVYRDAAIVLAPSRWEEAFGRIAAEAHVSGIPVVGSDRGGLPEAIGPGGTVVPVDAPIADWVKSVRALWDDSDAYAAASQAARGHAARHALNADVQIDQLLDLVRTHPAERIN